MSQRGALERRLATIAVDVAAVRSAIEGMASPPLRAAGAGACPDGEAMARL